VNVLEHVDRHTLQKLMDAGAQLVEVLPADEYDEEHIPGAINIPVKELGSRVSELDQSRPVIVYCHDYQ
jgi:rhodanese-related sulfurtransferase